MEEIAKMSIKQIWPYLQMPVIQCLDHCTISFLEQHNINLQADLPENLSTITSEDYRKVIETVSKFTKTAEKGRKTDLTLSSRELNSLLQPTYENYSQLNIFIKVNTFPESYEIQDDILIHKSLRISAFMLLLKLRKYLYSYSKTKLKITIESGVIQEKTYCLTIFNMDVSHFANETITYRPQFGNNLIEFILLAPYNKPIEELSDLERQSIQKVLENLKSIKVENGFIIIST